MDGGCGEEAIIDNGCVSLHEAINFSVRRKLSLQQAGSTVLCGRGAILIPKVFCSTMLL